MKATAILPVKRFAAAKQRLAAGLDDERREAVVEAMLGDVLEAIGEARSIERTIVVSGERRAAALAARTGAELLPDPAEATTSDGGSAAEDKGVSGGRRDTAAENRILSGGHNEAAMAGIAAARAAGAECVVLLPLDCPLLEPRELDRLLTGVPPRYVTIVPDRHGEGTNALVLTPPNAIEPAFGVGSRARHVELARAADVPHAVEEIPSLALDLDTPADVIALTRAYEAGRRARGRRTAKALGL